MIRHAPFLRILAPAMAATLFQSCDRPDPGMIEKVSLLEAELRERDRQLAAMEEEAKSESSSDAPDATTAPDLDAARAAYLGFVESLRGTLAQAMPELKFERTSVFPVEGPDPSKPILSKVAFRITGKNGRNGEVVVPLFADPAGSWLEPDTAEVVARFKTQLTAAAATPAAPAPAPQPAAPAPRPQPTDVMGAQRTVEVQWGDQPPAQPSPRPASPSPPAPQAQPQSPAMPKKVMPTSRDVIIDFE